MGSSRRNGWLFKVVSGFAVLWLSCAFTVQAESHLTYPAAPRGAVSENYFGTAVADPYRWFEDLDSPATRTWVKAEGNLTEGYLAANPARARIRARLAWRISITRKPTSSSSARFTAAST